MLEDTIAAIATPLGEGGLSLIRISGKEALAIGDRVFTQRNNGRARLRDSLSHTVVYGYVKDRNRILDEVLATVFLAPKSYTCEDTVEITCHGGILVTQKVLECVLNAGARAAEPGEFTRRAFLNGRIDLAQAEAVADLIHAKTGLALEAAHEQLSGKLSERVEWGRKKVIDVLAHVEAHIDFPDEDIAPDAMDSLIARLKECEDVCAGLLRYAEEGRILRKGIRAALIGRPNAGKSSLLNELLGQDRAIVSSIAGTTRDTIEETANIRGVPLVFIDTAGLRTAQDEIELEGIRRSRLSMSKAEMILHILDQSEPLHEVDREFLGLFPEKKKLLVLNKSDLPNRLQLPESLALPVIRVSCLNNHGLESLKDAISDTVLQGSVPADHLGCMINARHKNALERAAQAILQSKTALESGLSLELPAMDLHIAANALGEIVGKGTSEDLLDSIFRQFCIGK